MGIVSLGDFEEAKAVLDNTQQLFQLAHAYEVIANNIVREGGDNVRLRLQQLNQDMEERINGLWMQQGSSVEKEAAGGAHRATADATATNDPTQQDKGEGESLLVKSSGGASLVFKSDGSWRLFGIPSNNVIDRDGHILSSDSHKEYEAYFARQQPSVALRYWHVPLDLGHVDTFMYDEETGMVVVSGMFDKEFEDIPEGIQRTASEIDWGMSVGIPRKTIEREVTEPNVIKRYRLREISVLPTANAANLLTAVV